MTPRWTLRWRGWWATSRRCAGRVSSGSSGRASVSEETDMIEEKINMIETNVILYRMSKAFILC